MGAELQKVDGDMIHRTGGGSRVTQNGLEQGRTVGLLVYRNGRGHRYAE